jgi:hypothetical protein
MASKKIGPGDFVIGCDRAQRVIIWIDHFLGMTHAMNIAALAKKCGIKNQYFTDWRRGNANPSNARTMNREQLQAIAGALDVDEARLVGEAFRDLDLGLPPMMVVQASQ